MSIRALAMAVAFFLISFLPSFAEDSARVILVLDASGSMRAKIDGKSKMDIAKQVVGKIISTWRSEDEIGLIAYGHREKGKCSDIEVLREPGALNAADYMKAVNGLAPKGQTPMTNAVRMAAEALQYTEKKSTVILVSDGIENCDADPCAVAEDLKSKGIGLTVHTVGFGLDNQDAIAQLKCIAEKTGGTYTTANNAKELQKALAKSVAAPVAKPKPAAKQYNLLGHATMASGVELPEKFKDPAWAFFKTVTGEKGEHVQTQYHANMKANLPDEGDYLAVVTVGESSVEVPFKIEAGKATNLEANFDAGILKLSGFVDDATRMTDDGTSWELFDSAGNHLATNYHAQTMFFAKAGKYKVKLRLDQARSEQEFEVVAGQISDQKMSLGAGVIEVTALFSEGGKPVPEGAAIELRKPEASSNGKHEWIATEYGAPSNFKVKAGKYFVTVVKDYASGAAAIEVKSGDTAKFQVNINAGYLAVSAAGARSLVVFFGEKELDGKRKNLGTEYGLEFNKAFNAGSYHVMAYGEDDKLLGEKDFEVKAGSRTEGVIP
jgi:Ca-activated chloride channel homolog